MLPRPGLRSGDDGSQKKNEGHRKNDTPMLPNPKMLTLGWFPPILPLPDPLPPAIGGTGNPSVNTI